MCAAEGEQRLSGGNTTVVTRVGDTVRRSVGPWTPAVHDLLNHLAAVGFAGSPRVRGIDEEGREVLEYVDGDVGTLTAEEPLSRGVGSPLGPGQVIVHHDVSSYNTVRRPDGSLVVLDWDFCRPGDPIEDLAWAAWRWVPLMAGDRWHREYGVRGDPFRRQQANLDALLEGYGPSVEQHAALPEAIHAQMTGHARDLEDMAATDPAFAGLVDRGFAQAARDDADWWSAGVGVPRIRWGPERGCEE